MMDDSRAAWEGTGFGIVVAVAFALLIHVLPGDWLQPGSWQLGLVFVLLVVGAPGFVMVASGLARARSADPASVLAGSLAGAAVFDGLAIAFVPSLYGHRGAPLSGAAAGLLFGLAAVAFAGRLMGVPITRDSADGLRSRPGGRVALDDSGGAQATRLRP